MVLTTFGQLQEMAAYLSFSSDMDECSHLLRHKKKPCVVFSKIHIDTLSVFDADVYSFSSLFRPQLLCCRVAKEMVCPERRDFLLLRDWQRLVLDVSSADCCSKCFWIRWCKLTVSPLPGRQTPERFAVCQRLRCAAGEQPEKRLQEKLLFRAVCSGPSLVPGLHLNPLYSLLNI